MLYGIAVAIGAVAGYVLAGSQGEPRRRAYPRGADELSEEGGQAMSPMQTHRYPANWKEIARQVKEEAGWRCEACGKQCYRPGEAVTDWSRVLTVAHWPCEAPEMCERENLHAWCSVCHLRADAKMHAKHRRDRQIAETGQSRLLEAEG